MSKEQTAAETNDKKEYFPPKVVHSETITTRASQCALSDNSCAPGPLQS